VKPAALIVLAALVLGGFLYARSRDDSASAADASRTLRCLEAARVPASIEKSSTGANQVAVEHGRGALGPNVTLTSSKTYVSFLPSADEAAWFEGELRRAPGMRPDLVAHKGNALVTFGSTASAAERAAITACLA
jgi:hypothetical protein